MLLGIYRDKTKTNEHIVFKVYSNCSSTIIARFQINVTRFNLTSKEVRHIYQLK